MTKAERIRIGWSSVDVTPDKPVNLSGQFHMRISEKVLDPVTATVLVLGNGENNDDCVIFISADSVAVPGAVLSALRKKIGEKIPGIPVEKITINATHTHTAPDLLGSWYPYIPEGTMKASEYASFFVDRVAEAAEKAWKDMRPGAVSWGFGYAVLSHNRRTVYSEDISKRAANEAGKFVDGFAKMYGNTNDPAFSNMEGSEDNSVNILFTYDQKDKLTGAIINIPCPSQETEGMSQMSADFWHETRIELRKKYGKNLFVLPQCSAAGDLSPHAMIDKKAESRMIELKGISRRQEIAMRISHVFDEILSWASKDIRKEVFLKHDMNRIKLPARKITEEEYERVRKEFDELSRENNPKEYLAWFRSRDVIERYEKQKINSEIEEELHVIRVGDIAFTTSGSELFLDFGMRIKARSPATQTFLIQLSPGEKTFFTGGYLPTEKAEAGKGYSASVYCNIVGSDGGKVLVEKTLEAINKLFPSQN